MLKIQVNGIPLGLERLDWSLIRSYWIGLVV